MSKNERLWRSVSAGLVFAVLGIFAISNEDIGVDERHARGPAATGCATPGCAALARLTTELLSKPGSDSVAAGSAAQAAVERREAKILREAGAALVAMFRDEAMRDDAIGKNEQEAAARFLFETFPRDGAGIAIDVLSIGLGPEKTAKALEKIAGKVDDLASEGVLDGDWLGNFQAALDFARSAGGDSGR